MSKKKKKDLSVHFMTKIPNNKEGHRFIKMIRKHLNKDRYRLVIRGRGSRRWFGNQSYIPLENSSHYSLYFYQRIKDQNNPDHWHSKFWSVRTKLWSIEGKLKEILKEV
tara:strand:+ start:3838 stop:4164 length:327 start_codon:yes stop_codon:yes gene_type:complete